MKQINKQLPKISIITPSYNQGQYIEETILSVLNQNYSNFEYIIIDGGSSDNTIDIIKKHENGITYWVSEKDSGQSDALKKGFKIATGEIVTWLNSDDLLFPNTLHKVAEFFMANQNYDLLFGQYIEFDKEGDKDTQNLTMNEENLLMWTYTTPFAQPSTFYRKSLYDKVGGINESFQFSMDNNLFKRFILFGAKYSYHKDVFSKFRWHETSKSTNLIETCRTDDREIYCTYLRSLDNLVAKKCLALLKNLNLFIKSDEYYEININLTNKDILKSFAYFISFYLIQFYIKKDLNKAYSILEFFKSERSINLLFNTEAGRITKYLYYTPTLFMKILKHN